MLAVKMAGALLLFLLHLVASASSLSPAALSLSEDDSCSLLQTSSLSKSRVRALEQALTKADAAHFLAAVARRLRTTPDKLDPSLLGLHAMLIRHLQNDEPHTASIWQELRAAFKKTARLAASIVDAPDFWTPCENKDYDKYAEVACSFAPGGQIINATGRATDAYYCGAQKGIDWSEEPFNGKPAADLCHMKVGDAFKPDGFCGKHSDKELLITMVTDMPLWKSNPLHINIPSLECLLDLADCDIYYCQHCGGRCDETAAPVATA